MNTETLNQQLLAGKEQYNRYRDSVFSSFSFKVSNSVFSFNHFQFHLLNQFINSYKQVYELAKHLPVDKKCLATN